MEMKPIIDDHDLLITLNTKVDQISIDMKDMRDNILIRVAKLEQRADAADIYHAKIDLPRFERLADWVENIKSNYRFVVAFIALLSGMLGAFLNHLIQLWFPKM